MKTQIRGLFEPKTQFELIIWWEQSDLLNLSREEKMQPTRFTHLIHDLLSSSFHYNNNYMLQRSLINTQFIKYFFILLHTSSNTTSPHQHCI